jgi:phosphonate transport system substrate-binding protein
MQQPTAASATGALIIVHKDSPLQARWTMCSSRGKNLTLRQSATPTPPAARWCPATTPSPRTSRPGEGLQAHPRANHETNILAIANKQVDVSTNNSDAVERMKIKLPEKASRAARDLDARR